MEQHEIKNNNKREATKFLEVQEKKMKDSKDFFFFFLIGVNDDI